MGMIRTLVSEKPRRRKDKNQVLFHNVWKLDQKIHRIYWYFFGFFVDLFFVVYLLLLSLSWSCRSVQYRTVVSIFPHSWFLFFLCSYLNRNPIIPDIDVTGINDHILTGIGINTIRIPHRSWCENYKKNRIGDDMIQANRNGIVCDSSHPNCQSPVTRCCIISISFVRCE